ncbi:MAG: adaptor protein MecA [Oscillospiraceae bacterium]|jgi:hypothetical protein|nr:adaptor protein MecA [Oscillospiraceae bacterium]
MRIEAVTQRKIIVELSAEDLRTLDMTYEALDYTSIETRRVIWVILDRVREATGCDIDPSGQLLIDAMPRPTGGCILFFTLRGGAAEPFSVGVPPQRILRKQDQLMLAYEFSDVNALLDCARSCACSAAEEDGALVGDSELYTDGKRFRLLLCPAQDIAALKNFFSEFGRLCGEGIYDISATREHWRCLTRERALESLAGQRAARPRRVLRESVPFRAGRISVNPF